MDAAASTAHLSATQKTEPVADVERKYKMKKADRDRLVNLDYLKSEFIGSSDDRLVNLDYLKSEFIGSSDDAVSVPLGDLLDDVANKIPEELSTALAPPPTLPPPSLPKSNARSPFHEARRIARKPYYGKDDLSEKRTPPATLRRLLPEAESTDHKCPPPMCDRRSVWRSARESSDSEDEPPSVDFVDGKCEPSKTDHSTNAA